MTSKKRIAIIGNIGSGKSTLILAVMEQDEISVRELAKAGEFTSLDFSHIQRK